MVGLLSKKRSTFSQSWSHNQVLSLVNHDHTWHGRHHSPLNSQSHGENRTRIHTPSATPMKVADDREQTTPYIQPQQTNKNNNSKHKEGVKIEL